MLTCIFHPIDQMRVVEQDDAEKLIAKGVWFDCPAKARQYRNKVEDEIKQESHEVTKTSKRKLKEK